MGLTCAHRLKKRKNVRESLQSNQTSCLLPSARLVTNYNNVVEAGTDSDDEDKLHIVEEEGSLADGADCDSTLPDDEHPREHWDRGETSWMLVGRMITRSLQHALHYFTPLQETFIY